MNRVQIEIFLSTLLLAITGGILLFVGINEEERMSKFEQIQQAQRIEVGADLFEINCRGCHGLRGEGIAGLAPPLSDAYFFSQRLEDVGWNGDLEDYIVFTVSGGRQLSTRPELYPGAGKPAMPTWSERYGGPLRDDQIEALAAYILNWESTASGDVELAELPSIPGAESDDPVERGLSLFNSTGCIGCHTIDGISTGIIGPNLTQIGDIAATRIDGVSAEDYLRKSITAPDSYLVEGYDNLMLSTFSETISDQELEDLILFLLAQK
jgi:mono/diheme cytochrome c family protein